MDKWKEKRILEIIDLMAKKGVDKKWLLQPMSKEVASLEKMCQESHIFDDMEKSHDIRPQVILEIKKMQSAIKMCDQRDIYDLLEECSTFLLSNILLELRSMKSPKAKSPLVTDYEELEKELLNFGLTKKECSVYIHLIKHPSITAKQLNQLGLVRVEIHHTLTKLCNIGIVSGTSQHPTIYESCSPQNAFTILKSKINDSQRSF